MSGRVTPPSNTINDVARKEAAASSSWWRTVRARPKPNEDALRNDKTSVAAAVQTTITIWVLFGGREKWAGGQADRRSVPRCCIRIVFRIPCSNTF